MSKECILEIKDEVNVRFVGLDPATRRKMVEKLQYDIPYARHTPAYKLGRWDGKVSYCDVGGRTYVNLLNLVLPVVIEAGYDITLDDRRQTYDFNFEHVDTHSYAEHKWPIGHSLEGEPIVIREHQVNAINGLLDNLQAVTIASTGAGKTIICAILSEKVEKYGRSVVIVPSKDLVTQTYEDYVNMGLDVGVYYGDKKEIGHTHTICTWQGLEALLKKNDGKITIDDISRDVVCVICDETHKAKSDCLKKILSTAFRDCPIRWGMTGTLPEEEFERVIISAVIGEVAGEVSAKELQEKGYLAKLQIHIKQLLDGEQWSNYQSELSYLTTNKERVGVIGNMINDISDGGNTLVLVDRVKTGEMLKELIPDSVFINGNVKSTKRKEEYDETKVVDGKVIIATYGVASTGISINRIYNMVLIEPGKSFVRVIQSIGRGLRVAKDKDHVDVYDFTSNAKFAKRHLAKRKKFYKSQEYPFKIEKVKW